MEENYINYNLFKTRTGFDPLKFFENNKSISYENFKSYLNSRKVKSPGKDYYDRAIAHVNKEVEVEVAKPELDVVKIPEVEVEVAKPVKKQATTRKRRSRKKKSDE